MLLGTLCLRVFKIIASIIIGDYVLVNVTWRNIPFKHIIFRNVKQQLWTTTRCTGKLKIHLSHSHYSFQRLRDTYGKLDVEIDRLNGTGWFTTDPWDITSRFGGRWKTTDFLAGDVLIFTMRLAITMYMYFLYENVIITYKISAFYRIFHTLN